MKVSVKFSALGRRTLNRVTNTKKDNWRCHDLFPLYEDKTPDPTWRIWIFKMTACHPTNRLFGPACLMDSRVVIYPCDRMRCVIRCPCGLCSSLICPESEHSLQDLYHEHQQYHSAPHLNCICCIEILKLIPGFYYKKVISVSSGGAFPSPTIAVLRTAYEFGHDYTYDYSKETLSCGDCGKIFKTASNRERHTRNVHYKQKNECLWCGKLFGRPDNLKNHMKVHEKNVLCKASAVANTDSEDDLSDDSIENEMSFDTLNSNDEYSDVEDGPEDAKEAHHDEIKATTAETESIEVNLPSKLKKNEDSDLEVASDRFNTSANAKLYENNDDSASESSDSNIKSIIAKCEKCDKDFSSKFNLSVHERKIKYSCEECDESFCSKCAKSAHMKAKHGKQGFHCSNCAKEFSTKQHLKTHVQNKSANPCAQCSANFCNSHALKCHVFSDHTCKKCHICGGRYEYLNRHIENVHGTSSKN